MQRIYLVGAFVWIAVFLVISIADRPNGKALISTDDLAKYGAGAPSITTTASDDPWERAAKEYREARTPDLSKLSNAELDAYRRAASGLIARYWETQSALTLGPPVIGYLILFGVLPWIGRGFRSTQA